MASLSLVCHKMSRYRLIFGLWVASGAFITVLSSQISEKETFAFATDILNALPHEECDMIVASSLLPQGETPLHLKQGGEPTKN